MWCGFSRITYLGVDLGPAHVGYMKTRGTPGYKPLRFPHVPYLNDASEACNDSRLFCLNVFGDKHEEKSSWRELGISAGYQLFRTCNFMVPMMPML